MTTPKNII